MRVNKYIIFFVSIILFLANCDSNPTNSNNTTSENDKTFTLEIGQAQKFAWKNYTIGFDTVYSDNRIDTVSVTITGLAKIRIWVYKQNSDTLYYDMEKFNSNLDSYFYPSINPYDFLLYLKKLTPTETPENYKSYKATFEVRDYNSPFEHGTQIIPTSKNQNDILKYYYNVDRAEISGDTLTMRINHNGGCNSHFYIAYMSPLQFSKSSPVQADIYISHYNNNDFCNAMLYPSFRLDLSKIKELYQRQFGDSGEIILNLYDNNRGIGIEKTISYKF